MATAGTTVILPNGRTALQPNGQPSLFNAAGECESCCGGDVPTSCSFVMCFCGNGNQAGNIAITGFPDTREFRGTCEACDHGCGDIESNTGNDREDGYTQVESTCDGDNLTVTVRAFCRIGRADPTLQNQWRLISKRTGGSRIANAFFSAFDATAQTATLNIEYREGAGDVSFAALSASTGITLTASGGTHSGGFTFPGPASILIDTNNESGTATMDISMDQVSVGFEFVCRGFSPEGGESEETFAADWPVTEVGSDTAIIPITGNSLFCTICEDPDFAATYDVDFEVGDCTINMLAGAAPFGWCGCGSQDRCTDSVSLWNNDFDSDLYFKFGTIDNTNQAEALVTLTGRSNSAILIGHKSRKPNLFTDIPGTRALMCAPDGINAITDPATLTVELTIQTHPIPHNFGSATPVAKLELFRISGSGGSSGNAFNIPQTGIIELEFRDKTESPPFGEVSRILFGLDNRNTIVFPGTPGVAPIACGETITFKMVHTFTGLPVPPTANNVSVVTTLNGIEQDVSEYNWDDYRWRCQGLQWTFTGQGDVNVTFPSVFDFVTFKDFLVTWE